MQFLLLIKFKARVTVAWTAIDVAINRFQKRGSILVHVFDVEARNSGALALLLQKRLT